VNSALFNFAFEMMISSNFKVDNIVKLLLVIVYKVKV